MVHGGMQSRRAVGTAAFAAGVLLTFVAANAWHRGPTWQIANRSLAAAAATSYAQLTAEEQHVGDFDGSGTEDATPSDNRGSGGGSGSGTSRGRQSTHRRSSKASAQMEEGEEVFTAGGGTTDPAEADWQPASYEGEDDNNTGVAAGSSSGTDAAADAPADDTGSSNGGEPAADGNSADVAADIGSDQEDDATADGDGSSQSGGAADSVSDDADSISSKGDAGSSAGGDDSDSSGNDRTGGEGSDSESVSATGSSGGGGSDKDSAAEKGDGSGSGDKAAQDSSSSSGDSSSDSSGGSVADESSSRGQDGGSEHTRQRSRHEASKKRRESRGPIQKELLTVVEAAANSDGAVMLAVTNKDGALFQLPQLLASMRLVPQEDATRHLVVVTYSGPAQAACKRQHAYCVLDDFGTGGLGGGTDGSVDGFAGWGSLEFKQITWRKIQLVQDILLQGFAVLSVDLDIVVFKNPLDPAYNPWMNRDLDIWTAVDNGKMLNCGFYFVRPTDAADSFMRTWLGRFDVEQAEEIWEQAEFNQILKGTHATLPELRWEALDEEWFVDLCFYLEARAVLPNQEMFGKLFVETSDKLGNWDQMFGFHAACCKGGGPALPECKRSTATALMHYQIKTSPAEWP